VPFADLLLILFSEGHYIISVIFFKWYYYEKQTIASPDKVGRGNPDKNTKCLKVFLKLTTSGLLRPTISGAQ
jgi:hypothetical protein